YVRSVLRGGGRAGKKVKMSKRAQKVGAASGKADAKSADAGAESAADSADAEADSADGEAASAQDTEDVKDEEDAKSADDSRDEKGPTALNRRWGSVRGPAPGLWASTSIRSCCARAIDAMSSTGTGTGSTTRSWPISTAAATT